MSAQHGQTIVTPLSRHVGDGAQPIGMCATFFKNMGNPHSCHLVGCGSTVPMFLCTPFVTSPNALMYTTLFHKQLIQLRSWFSLQVIDLNLFNKQLLLLPL